MSSGYVTFKCPGCKSTSTVSKRSIRAEFFLCPVCFESEIHYKDRIMLGIELGEQLVSYFTPEVIKLKAN